MFLVVYYSLSSLCLHFRWYALTCIVFDSVFVSVMYRESETASVTRVCFSGMVITAAVL